MENSNRPDVLNDYAKRLIEAKARQLSRRCDFSRSDYEDLQQDMITHLLEQARHFDASRACLPVFITMVVRSHVAMILRTRGRKKRAAGLQMVSLETTIDASQGVSAPWRDRITMKDHQRRLGTDQNKPLSDDVGQVLGSMPEGLRRVAQSLSQAPPAAVARELGISRRQVRNAVERIREHFQRAGLGGS